MRTYKAFSLLTASLIFVALVVACNPGRAPADPLDSGSHAADKSDPDARDIAKGPPSLRGTVTLVQPARTGTGRGMIRVEERPGQTSGDAKAVVSITSATLIYERDGPGLVRIPFERIQTGWLADVWFEGPVAESYPVQATAGTLIVQRP